MKRKTGWFMNIIDKTEINEDKCCPPHYLPHKLPFGKKIADEPCHFHKAPWRMAHHCSFCRLIECKNYEFMMKKHDEWCKSLEN